MYAHVVTHVPAHSRACVRTCNQLIVDAGANVLNLKHARVHVPCTRVRNQLTVFAQGSHKHNQAALSGNPHGLKAAHARHMDWTGRHNMRMYNRNAGVALPGHGSFELMIMANHVESQRHADVVGMMRHVDTEEDTFGSAILSDFEVDVESPVAEPNVTDVAADSATAAEATDAAPDGDVDEVSYTDPDELRMYRDAVKELQQVANDHVATAVPAVPQPSGAAA